MKKRTIALFLTAAAAAAAMTGCSNRTAQITPSTEETTKTQETQTTEAQTEAVEDQRKELVVLGSNGAGLIAAVQAVEDGIDPAKILILSGDGELAADLAAKEDFVNAAETAEQFEAEIEDTYDTYLADTMKAGKNSNNPEMAEFLVENAEEAKNWIEGLGIKLKGVEKKDGSSVARSYTMADEGSLSKAISEKLAKKVEELKIPVVTGAVVKEFIQNKDGDVIGVKAEMDGTEETIDCIAVVAADKELLPIFSELDLQNGNGVLVNSCSEVVDAASETTSGLYAVGELIDAGVHGEGILPGNDMTATIVYGETAGVEAAIYISDNRK